ncbi:MAG: hypothetical protein EA401_13465 [Planctomycetota bacterium]|nr:MAG: hypothetical protein EA401_13465 [Planctomycetota bacterium]
MEQALNTLEISTGLAPGATLEIPIIVEVDGTEGNANTGWRLPFDLRMQSAQSGMNEERTVVTARGNRISLTYLGNENDAGTPPKDTELYQYNTTATILGPSDLSRTGYSFVSWNGAADGSGTRLVEDDSLDVGETQHILYAQWQANTYTVSFVTSGGSSHDDVTVTFNSDYGVLPIPTRTGYGFTAWHDSDGNVIQGDTTVSIAADHTLTAQWTANTYTVSFDAGDDVENPAAITVTFGETYGDLPSPQREGYELAAWNDSDGNAIAVDTQVSIAANHTLTAQWTANTYTVTFDTSGGSDHDAITVTFGQSYGVLPFPERDGYTFDGWHDVNGNTIVVDSPVEIASDHVLTAQWTGNTYEVQFDAGEEVTNPESTEVVFGDTYGELPSLTRTGYTFDGWLDPDGEMVDGDTVVAIVGAHTLTAQWTAIEVVVQLDPQNGETPQTREVAFGAVYGDLPTPERTGFTFIGWFDDPQDGNEITAESVMNIPNDHSIFALWDADDIEVSFASQGGSSELSQVVTLEAPYGDLPTPTRTGYTFQGWFDAAEGGSQITADTLVSTAEDHTLYAQWTANSYEVSFDNLAGYEVDDIIVVFDQPYTNLPTPEREGFTFQGWYTGLLDGTLVENTTLVTTDRDHVLFARWEDIEGDGDGDDNGDGDEDGNGDEDDTLPPQWAEGSPAITRAGHDRLHLALEADKEGRAFVVALPSGSTAPTADQVRAGHNADGEKVATRATLLLNQAGAITRLQSYTAYDVYILAESTEGHANEDLAVVDGTTLFAQPAVPMARSGITTIYNALSPGTAEAWDMFTQAFADQPAHVARAFVWNAQEQSYIELADLNATPETTAAVFLATRRAKSLDFSGYPATEVVEVRLYPGWNFIGLPPVEIQEEEGFELEIEDRDVIQTRHSWQQLQFMENETVLTQAELEERGLTRAWLWDPREDIYQAVRMAQGEDLQSTSGYWVLNSGDNVVLMRRLMILVLDDINFDHPDLNFAADADLDDVVPPPPPGRTQTAPPQLNTAEELQEQMAEDG